MRVLAYLHAYPPLRWLGGELMTSRLLTALVDAGHDVKVLARTAESPWTHRGVEVVPRVKGVTNASLGGCDVFVTHPEIAAYYYPRLAGTPYVGVVHNLSTGTLDGLTRYRPDVVVANAQSTAAVLRSRGFDPVVLHPPTTRPAPVDGLQRRFVTLVNVSQPKGADVFYALARRRPDLQFLGVLGGYNEQMFADPMPDNVHLIGQTPSMEVVYAMTRVLLVPSAVETYGMVAAEALAAGIPVLAADLPGLREAGGDGATYLPRGDIDAWEAELARLDDPFFHAPAAARALERGEQVLRRSTNDLSRWVDLIERAGTPVLDRPQAVV